MDARQADHDLAPAGRRWALLAALFALGLAYVAAFVFFSVRGRDFIAAHYNERARMGALAGDGALPRSLQFGRGRDGNGVLGAGWYGPEDEGTWSARAQAWLYLKTPASTPVELVVHGEAFLAAGHPQIMLSLSAGGQPVGRRRVELDAPSFAWPVTVPAGAAADGLIELRLQIDAPSSQFRAGAGRDTRSLGVQLKRIDLRRAEAPGQ